jgi:hypothetical protein
VSDDGIQPAYARRLIRSLGIDPEYFGKTLRTPQDAEHIVRETIRTLSKLYHPEGVRPNNDAFIALQQTADTIETLSVSAVFRAIRADKTSKRSAAVQEEITQETAGVQRQMDALAQRFALGDFHRSLIDSLAGKYVILARPHGVYGSQPAYNPQQLFAQFPWFAAQYDAFKEHETAKLIARRKPILEDRLATSSRVLLRAERQRETLIEHKAYLGTLREQLGVLRIDEGYRLLFADRKASIDRLKAEGFGHLVRARKEIRDRFSAAMVEYRIERAAKIALITPTVTALLNTHTSLDDLVSDSVKGIKSPNPKQRLAMIAEVQQLSTRGRSAAEAGIIKQLQSVAEAYNALYIADAVVKKPYVEEQLANYRNTIQALDTISPALRHRYQTANRLLHRMVASPPSLKAAKKLREYEREEEENVRLRLRGGFEFEFRRLSQQLQSRERGITDAYTRRQQYEQVLSFYEQQRLPGKGIALSDHRLLEMFLENAPAFAAAAYNSSRSFFHNTDTELAPLLVLYFDDRLHIHSYTIQFTESDLPSVTEFTPTNRYAVAFCDTAPLRRALHAQQTTRLLGGEVQQIAGRVWDADALVQSKLYEQFSITPDHAVHLLSVERGTRNMYRIDGFIPGRIYAAVDLANLDTTLAISED